MYSLHIRTAYTAHVLRAMKGGFTPMSLHAFWAFLITKI